METLLKEIWQQVGTPVTYLVWGYLGLSAIVLIITIIGFIFIFKQWNGMNKRMRRF